MRRRREIICNRRIWLALVGWAVAFGEMFEPRSCAEIRAGGSEEKNRVGICGSPACVAGMGSTKNRMGRPPRYNMVKLIWNPRLPEKALTMATRDEFLEHLWANRINAYMQEDWIDKEIAMSQRYPDSPFSDIGPVLSRLLALGATRRELSLVARVAEYNGVFDALYALDGHPGVDSGNYMGIAEMLLRADPSGLEGRPGSAPEKD